MTRRLLVNADDLGYDPAIDAGLLEAHARGLVTMATAMVDTPFAAAALAAAPRTLAVGLHLVLAPGLAPAAVEAELLRQLDRFERLRGAPPTHLDGHKHAHAEPGALPTVARVAAARGLPVRALDGPMRATLRAAGVRTTDAFIGDASLRPGWNEPWLLEAIAALGEGTTELMCHPGRTPSHVETSFGAEREIELAALVSPRAAEAVRRAGVVLASWATLGR